MNVSRVKYPGYRASWGSTSQWFREPEGPFVCGTYSPPDDEGMSVRRETFHWSLDDAEATARSSATGCESLSTADGAPGLGGPRPGATTSKSEA